MFCKKKNFVLQPNTTPYLNVLVKWKVLKIFWHKTLWLNVDSQINPTDAVYICNKIFRSNKRKKVKKENLMTQRRKVWGQTNKWKRLRAK